MWDMIASSMSSPATRTESLVAISPKEMMAISVVPPPMSTTMEPRASSTGSPAPNAAAMGSGTKYTRRAPARSAESMTAFFSTAVIPLGTAITTRGPMILLLLTLRMKYESMASVISKSLITPSRSGRTAEIEPGVFPIISLALQPTAFPLSSTLLVFL